MLIHASNNTDVQYEVADLRACISNLVSLLALPMAIPSPEAEKLIHGFTESLPEMIPAEFVHLRTCLPNGGEKIFLHFAAGSPWSVRSKEIMRAMRGEQSRSRSMLHPEGNLLIAEYPLGGTGEFGLLAAGADETGFPRPTHDVILSVAANLVALHLQQAWREAEKKRAEAALRQALAARYETLTAREKQVMPCVTSGLLNKQTADRLGISEITVRVLRGRVMRKMDAQSLADLVRIADRIGIH